MDIVHPGRLFVVSAPSGAGKSTILRALVAGLPGLAFSVSHTTRPSRQGECHGRDYYFVNAGEFARIREGGDGGFLEWAEVHGNLYGTSCREVDRLLSRGVDVFLDIDVQGADQVRKGRNAALFLFIAPPSMGELRRRLAARGSESAASLALRLANACRELARRDDYDFLVVNDNVDEAIAMCRSIVLAERSRGRRHFSGLPVELDFNAA